MKPLPRSTLSTRSASLFYLVTAFLLISIISIESAHAIPAFARRHKMSCVTCHVGFPMLNGFGEFFAGNGYQLPGADISEQLIDTGDEDLLLLDRVPLAVRVDTFFQVRDDTKTSNDFQAPFSLKILSSAPIKEDISYYFYFFVDERGDITGIEDAFIYFNNGYKDVDLDMRIGQFQASDILFPREQRLTFQDYTYYVTAVSNSNFRLTYDRIVEVSYNFDLTDSVGMGVVAAITNGNGIGVADSDRNFDSDEFKNFYGKVSFEFEGDSIGFYGYTGREENSSSIKNEFFRIGPDFTIMIADTFRFWGNFLYGEDSNARFSSSGNTGEIESWGGFLGATYPFMDGWIASLLYNRVKVYGKQELDANTLTVNLSYWLARNFKLTAEATADLEDTSTPRPQKTHTGVLGIVLAF
ncbi:MAG: hypothetical protein HOG63_12995 [Nitrospina sp.]|nr:hypothetical protein [Nitrospina sp.]